MIRPSFVPPEPIRQLRDLTRYRIDLVGERGREKNRVEKLLEDAGIKVSVVVSDVFGVSGRAMMAALIAGERDPHALADLARCSMRRKVPALVEAFTGRFSAHHGFLLARMLAHVDAINADIAAVEARIEEHLSPFAAEAAHRLETIPGIGPTAARVIIAEIGLDMSRFPTPAHLASWARFAPGVNESAGKAKSSATGHGNRYLARALGEAAVAASRTNTFLAERYRRIARRRGKKRAIVAIGRSLLMIIWNLLTDPNAVFIDLGPNHFDHARGTQRAIRAHLRALHALGYTATLSPAA